MKPEVIFSLVLHTAFVKIVPQEAYRQQAASYQLISKPASWHIKALVSV
jgi:hypothetical protein